MEPIPNFISGRVRQFVSVMILEFYPSVGLQANSSPVKLRIFYWTVVQLCTSVPEMKEETTRMKKMTQEEKHAQIKKEAKATFGLFFLCFVWHVGFAYGLSGVDIRIWNLPLWWVLSTPGVFVVALVGLTYLLKKVFVNFDLEPEVDDHDK